LNPGDLIKSDDDEVLICWSIVSGNFENYKVSAIKSIICFNVIPEEGTYECLIVLDFEATDFVLIHESLVYAA